MTDPQKRIKKLTEGLAEASKRMRDSGALFMFLRESPDTPLKRVIIANIYS